MNNAIEIKGLNKKLGKFELKDINFELPCGCIMGLLGENGAGKSTLIRLILDIYHKDSGSIVVLGRENTDRFELTKEDIGVVLDDVGIPDSLNAKEVGKIMKLTFKNWDNEAYYSYLEKFEIPEKLAFKKLSKGMKMKLGIAVALSHKARLLIMDEPTSGLDPVVRNEFVDILEDFTRNENNSVLISSHIVSDLEKICDYVAFLHKGEIMICEEKDKLLDEYAIIRCTQEQFSTIDESAVKSKKETPYAIEAIVLRNAIPEGVVVNPITIEELFVYTIKGAERI